jgi:hypothetical protein
MDVKKRTMEVVFNLNRESLVVQILHRILNVSRT